MIRLAAAADLHYDRNSEGKLRHDVELLAGTADLLLLAGDLTQVGDPAEAAALARDMRHSKIPVIAVLGNHDYHSDQIEDVSRILEDAGIVILDNDSATFEIGEFTVGIYGQKGFGGGYLGACCSDFGEPEMKAFIRHTKAEAEKLRAGLERLETDYRVALLHYSPIPDTLLGEKKEIYPFLGSYMLAQSIDEAGADIAFHGHAHRGIEKGVTPGGVPVRNVAQPVIRHTFNVYNLSKERQIELAHQLLKKEADGPQP